MKKLSKTPHPNRWSLLIHDQARLKDARHPYAPRFLQEHRPSVERLLSASEQEDDQLDAEFRVEGRSLRTVVREIPPVFGSFY